MGLKDRLLDAVAKLFVPAMDHPSRGGLTGDDGMDDAPDPGGAESDNSDGDP